MGLENAPSHWHAFILRQICTIGQLDIAIGSEIYGRGQLRGAYAARAGFHSQPFAWTPNAERIPQPSRDMTSELSSGRFRRRGMLVA
jgi:hypothetical protein